MTFLFILFSIFLLSPINIFPTVGTNNFTFHIGGTLEYSHLSGNNNHSYIPHSFSFIKGGATIELGHLYLFNHDKIIHAADSRLGFGITYGKSFSQDSSIISLSTYIGSTYTLGLKTKKGRLLFDILGVDLGVFIANQKTTVEKFTNNSFSGNHFLINIPLPLGIQYIYDKGLVLGFRHRIGIAMAPLPSGYTITTEKNNSLTKPNDGGIFGSNPHQHSIISYNMNFSIGYIFGY